jgi:hypothetical protein
VKHATEAGLDSLESLLERLRSVPGLVEKRRGVFYRGSRAFLHFHEDPTGMYADVRLGEDFERLRVTTRREQNLLVSSVRSAN